MPTSVQERILIVDDHPVVRRGLEQIFQSEPGFDVCGLTESVAEALMVVPKLDPDLIVSDLMLDGRGGLELTQQIVTFHPHVPVLIVSMLDEQLYAQRALAAGARGYVMKRSTDDEVIRAAHEVLAGRIYVSEAVRKQMQASDPAPEVAMTSPVEALTDRELEVFLLIGQGYAPRHIAEQLNLSVSTVEVYRERLKEKLGLKSSPVLLRYAIRWCKDHNLP